ncbi:MAG: hypothetical protein SFX74_12905 [Fimbriimonadaceae bacterium]|nr:hypothetical protein [Fimbriimonadaceae bacterium]
MKGKWIVGLVSLVALTLLACGGTGEGDSTYRYQLTNVSRVASIDFNFNDTPVAINLGVPGSQERTVQADPVEVDVFDSFSGVNLFRNTFSGNLRNELIGIGTGSQFRVAGFAFNRDSTGAQLHVAWSGSESGAASVYWGPASGDVSTATLIGTVAYNGSSPAQRTAFVSTSFPIRVYFCQPGTRTIIRDFVRSDTFIPNGHYIVVPYTTAGGSNELYARQFAL